MAGVGVLFMAIVVAYVVLSKKLKASDTMQIKQLREGTQEKSFSFEIFIKNCTTYIYEILLQKDICSK